MSELCAAINVEALYFLTLGIDWSGAAFLTTPAPALAALFAAGVGQRINHLLLLVAG